MRKSIFFGLLLASMSAIFLVSCKDDDPVYLEPTITIAPSVDTIEIYAGDTIAYQIGVTADDDLTSVKFTSEVGGNQQIMLDSTLAAGVKSFNMGFNLIFPATIPAGTVSTFSVVATTAHKTGFADSYIKILPDPIVDVMDVFTAIELKAQADGPVTAGENLSFYASSANGRYTYDEAADDETSQIIDMVFTHHSVYKNSETNAEMSLQSPNDQNLVTMWENLGAIPFPYDATNKNQSYFKVLDSVDWENLDFDSIETTIGDIGTMTVLRGINDGDYIGFMTADGKYGIIMVVATNPIHNPYTDATITFDVKVQRVEM